jgi:hypothetical protein
MQGEIASEVEAGPLFFKREKGTEQSRAEQSKAKQSKAEQSAESKTGQTPVEPASMRLTT